MVLDTVPTAEIDIVHGYAALTQLTHECCDGLGSLLEDRRLGDLGTDMTVYPGHVDVRERSRVPQHFKRHRVRNAELVVTQTRGDIGMSAGIDIQVDAQQYPRALPHGTGDTIDDLDLLRGFDIERQDPFVERIDDLVVPFSHAAEGDAVGGKAFFQRPVEFTARPDVGTEPFPCDQPEQSRGWRSP